MKFTKRSPVTGRLNTMEVNCTPEEYSLWCRGKMIQDAMPNASPDEREFLLSGFTPEDWENTFGNKKD